MQMMCLAILMDFSFRILFFPRRCQIDDAFLEQYLDIASVKVSSMDEEHEECSQCLRVLVKKRFGSSKMFIEFCRSRQALEAGRDDIAT